MRSVNRVIGCGADRLPGRGQRDVDTLGHQHGRVAFDAQRRQPVVVGAWASRARHVHPLAGIGALGLGSEPSA